jgi:prolipoprotein diacylglyceryltransferase
MTALGAHLLVRGRSPFQRAGRTGFILGAALGLALAWQAHLSLAILGALIVSAALTFFVVGLITRRLLGDERLVFYHHAAALVGSSAALLAGLGAPLLPYLDRVAVGLLMFLACGRLGCLMVGCCHGRPSRFGVRYSETHAQAGFDEYLVGVRLWPVQSVEALLALVLAVLGAARLWTDRAAPGVVLADSTIAYGTLRFVLEWLRGDEARPRWLGLSEAQWSTLALLAALIAIEWLAARSLPAWHVAATAMLVLGALFAIARRSTMSARILDPRHVREVAYALHELPVRADRSGITFATTSLGLRLSWGRVNGRPHIGLSGASGRGARRLIRLIRELTGGGAVQCIDGQHGVLHLIFEE